MSNEQKRPAVVGQLNQPVRPSWNDCAHEWLALVDSMYSNEHSEEVKCIVCGCPGDRMISTGEVFWPAT